MNSPKEYVRTDEHGVKRVSNTRVMLDSILAGFHQGHSPESIQQQYPSLSLEEVYGTITYYLANQSEVNEYLQRQQRIWQQERERAAQRESSVLQRMRGLKKEGVSTES